MKMISRSCTHQPAVRTDRVTSSDSTALTYSNASSTRGVVPCQINSPVVTMTNVRMTDRRAHCHVTEVVKSAGVNSAAYSSLMELGGGGDRGIH